MALVSQNTITQIMMKTELLLFLNENQVAIIKIYTEC